MDRTYTMDELKNLLAPLFPAYAVYKAILFGSYARGEATQRSDVDLVVDSRGKLLNINFYGLLEDIVQRLGKKIDLIELSEIQKGSEIDRIIAREGVVIYEAVTA